MVAFATCKEEWLRQYIGLENGIPSYYTFRRVFQLLDPKALKIGVSSWVNSLQSMADGQVIAIDGKTLRHSFDTWSGQKSLHLLNAWATDLGIAIGCEKVDGKSNEIPSAVDIIEKLTLKGHVVTLDALGCQRSTAAKIIDKGGDYVLCAKKNQPGLYESLKEFFDDCGDFQEVEHDVHEVVEKVHGRIEERKCWAVGGEAKWLGIDKRWKKIETIAMIRRKRTIRGKSSVETSYYISSLPCDAEKIARIARAHWRVENSLHWVLDVTMNEDMSRVRKDYGAENLAILRRQAVSMVNQVKGKMSVRGALKFAGWENSFLELVLLGIRQQ
jgi:predicted transposase YbfD/YdcC